MFTMLFVFFFFKQKTAYEMRISDWSSDVCSSDLPHVGGRGDDDARIAQVDGALRRVRVLIFDHLSHRAVGVGEDAAIGGGIGGAKAEHRDPRPRYERAAQPAHRGRAQHRADRKSVGEGKRVSGRVDLGGRRLLKKKKTT